VKNMWRLVIAVTAVSWSALSGHWYPFLLLVLLRGKSETKKQDAPRVKPRPAEDENAVVISED